MEGAFRVLVDTVRSRNGAWCHRSSATRAVPARFRNDLRHVAVAATGHAHAVVSWNFRHLVNVRTRRAVHAVRSRLGDPSIEIVSPEEV